MDLFRRSRGDSGGQLCPVGVFQFAEIMGVDLCDASGVRRSSDSPEEASTIHNDTDACAFTQQCDRG